MSQQAWNKKNDVWCGNRNTKTKAIWDLHRSLQLQHKQASNRSDKGYERILYLFAWSNLVQRQNKINSGQSNATSIITYHSHYIVYKIAVDTFSRRGELVSFSTFRNLFVAGFTIMCFNPLVLGYIHDI